MALPTSRNTDYTGSTPVKGGDLNDIQDSIIGSKHKLLTFSLQLTGFVNCMTPGVAPDYRSGNLTFLYAKFVAAAATVGAQLAVAVPKGTRVVNARFYVKDVAGQPALRSRVLIGDRLGASTDLSTTINGVPSAGDGTVQTLSHNGINYTIGAGDGPLFVAVGSVIDATGTYEVRAIELDVDRL